MPPHGLLLLTSFLSLSLSTTPATPKATDASAVKITTFAILPYLSMPPPNRAFTTLPHRPSNVVRNPPPEPSTDLPKEIFAAAKPKAPAPPKLPKEQPKKKIGGIGVGDSGGPSGEGGANSHKNSEVKDKEKEGKISGEEFSSMVGKWKDSSLVSVIVVVAGLAFLVGMW